MTVKSKTEDYGGINPTALKKQIEDLRDRNEWLSAQIRALGGSPKKPDDPFDSLTVLERVAFTLARADETCSALQPVAFDPTGHHTPHPDDRAIVGSATRRARYQRDKLERHLENALDAWEEAKDNEFLTLSKHKTPKVRCRRRDCAKYDRRVPAWDVNGKGNEFCSGCGERLPAPEEAA